MNSPALVGRGEYLAELDAALARTRDGGPATLLIGGEAGVGKTRLITEFAAMASGTGARVLAGGCLDLGADGLPFAPFAAMLRELVRDMGAAGVAALLPGRATREFARLLPEFGEATPEADPGVARARLFEQMLTLLERLAETSPVVLIIEDAHWADRSTRDLIAFLIGSQQVLDRVLIMVSYRSDELHRTHPLRPLLAELAGTPGCGGSSCPGWAGCTLMSWWPGSLAGSRNRGWRTRYTGAAKATRCSSRNC